MVLAPERDDGLGILLLELNADTHFSFTNALGLITTDQVRALESACAQSRGRAGSSRCVWALPLAVQSSKCDPRKGSSQ